MRRMFSEKQIKEMISAGAQGEIAEALEGDISIGGDLSVAGDSSVTGDLDVTGDISGNAITANSILQINTGYAGEAKTLSDADSEHIYVGVVQTGNKLTIVDFFSITRTSGSSNVSGIVLNLTIPSEVGAKLYPYTIGENDWLYQEVVHAFSTGSAYIPASMRIRKNSNTSLDIIMTLNNTVANTPYFLRFEATFLLSDSLIPSGE